MPDPVTPPPPLERELPAGIDDLVRSALRGGSVARLREALEEARTPPPSEGATSPVAPAPPPAPAAAASPAAPPPAPAAAASPAAPPPEPLASLACLEQLVRYAADCWSAGDRLGFDFACDAAAAAVAFLQEMRPSLHTPDAPAPASGNAPPPEPLAPPPEAHSPAPPAGPPAEPSAEAISPPRTIPLPPIRHPFMLVIDGNGAAELAAALERGLEIDPATARMHALVHHTHVVLRGADREALERRAARVRALTRLRATVLAREELRTLESPLLVLGALPGLRWRVTAAPLWEMDVDPAAWTDTFELEPSAFSLAVRGEVVIRRFREGRSQTRLTRLREDGPRELGERRVHVLDLHGPDRSLRLVVGITDFRELPGHDPASSVLSARALIETLPRLFPGIIIEGRRACEPAESVPTSLEGDRVRAELTGWSTWEEHSAICLLHHRRAGPTPARIAPRASSPALSA